MKVLSDVAGFARFPALIAPARPPVEPKGREDEVGIGRKDLIASLQHHLERRVEGRVEEAIEAAPESPFEKLREFFSPESVAERTAGFVIRGFSRTSFGSEDTSESRRAFVDFITPFIRQGVDDALAIFAGYEDEVREPAEETFRRVGERLGEFADAG